MPLDISLVQVLDTHADGRMQDVHVAVPATIVLYDAPSQTATVQPVIRKPLTSSDGVLVFETPPQIPSVPVVAMRGGGFLVSVPLSAGDGVLLVFSEQSYSEWRQTGQISNPKDVRRHGTGYPYAIPGIAPDSKALQSASANSLVIGRDGQQELITIGSGQLDLGASGVQYVALANLVLNQLNALVLTLASATCSTGPVTFPVAFTPGSVAASLVRAK